MAPRTRGRASKESSATSEAYFRVLITGANTGLGYDTSRRLIDEFLASRPESAKLNLIVGTRSAAKSSATISRLSDYVVKKHRFKPAYQNADDDEGSSSSSRGGNASGSRSVSSRVLLTSAELDLTELPTVIQAARRLRRTYVTLDALVCNAGIACWTGLDWPQALLSCTFDFVHATTWPANYMHSALGLRTKSQLGRDEVGAATASGTGKKQQTEGGKGGGGGGGGGGGDESEEEEEPPLGRVFCANVFGHYILAHELGPLLSAAKPNAGRIIWISSIEAEATELNSKDLQSIQGGRAYNSSKRVTDVLALSSTLAATRSLTRSFLSDPSHTSYRALNPQPRQYVCHPGVVSTDIIQLPTIVAWAKRQSFYIARWLGSPWHTITGYKGAVAPVWLALSPQSTLDAIEERSGPGKWGSATDRRGCERVKRTEVDGWGWGGRVEASSTAGTAGEALAGVSDETPLEKLVGRRRGVADVTEKDLEEFDKLGVAVWRELEKLREDWYELMDDAGVIDDEDEE